MLSLDEFLLRRNGVELFSSRRFRSLMLIALSRLKSVFFLMRMGRLELLVEKLLILDGLKLGGSGDISFGILLLLLLLLLLE